SGQSRVHTCFHTYFSICHLPLFRECRSNTLATAILTLVKAYAVRKPPGFESVECLLYKRSRLVTISSHVTAYGQTVCRQRKSSFTDLISEGFRSSQMPTRSRER